MPKLKLETIQKNKEDIERCAVECFTKYGFTGASVRIISKEANVAIGKLYTYYPDKKSLYKAVLIKLSKNYFKDAKDGVEAYVQVSQFPKNLDLIAEGLLRLIKRNTSFMKLMFIDVVEFDGEHLKEVFSDLYRKFQGVIGEKMKGLKLSKDSGFDPSFAFIMIYSNFYHHYMTTKLFKLRKPYGPYKDEEVIKNMIKIFLKGLEIDHESEE